MDHPFMVEVARELALRGVATLRYQFPYMERGAKRPDPPQLAQATVRAAVAAALDRLPGLQLIAGGKSFGGRMTSQAQAKAGLRGVCGLAFLGHLNFCKKKRYNAPHCEIQIGKRVSHIVAEPICFPS
jgi:predicted alpha/beta-hydrolase family hydrolase